MSANVPQRRQSDLVGRLDSFRPEMVRISPEPVHGIDRAVGSLDPGDVAYDAVVKHYGTVKAAACALGNGDQPLDQSLMKREIETLKLERLHRRDPKALAVVLDALNRLFTQQVDPFVRMQQLIAAVRSDLNELEQGVQFAKQQRS